MSYKKLLKDKRLISSILFVLIMIDLAVRFSLVKSFPIFIFALILFLISLISIYFQHKNLKKFKILLFLIVLILEISNIIIQYLF